jgi:hypothetical protein
VRAGLGVVAPLVPGLGAFATPGGQIGQALAEGGMHQSGRAAQVIGGELALLAALAQAKGAAGGLPGFDPNSTATQASRAALAQGFGHPGRAIESIRTGPDPGMAWLAGALEMASDPINIVGLPGHRATRAAEEVAPKVAAPVAGKLLAGLADRQAAREALTTASEKVTGKAGGLPKQLIPKVGGARQYGPVPPPLRAMLADLPAPEPPKFDLPERPEVGPQWQHYGPETIHPGEDVTPELLDRFAKLRQFPNPRPLDIESEIGAMRDPVDLLQQAYGDQWQNRLAALTGGKWGQPGSGARLVNGRVMLGDLDLTTPLRDYLETRGGARGEEFKGALKAILPGKEPAPSASSFTGTLDDVRNLITSGDKGNMGGYAPNDPAFYQKRANVDPAQVPALLDQLVQEGTLGRLPDGSLGIKPAQAAPLSNVDIPPSITDPAERAAWQARYVGQSRAGTDILAAGDKVAGGDLTQADLNALSPQERMAALRKLATIPTGAKPPPINAQGYSIDEIIARQTPAPAQTLGEAIAAHRALPGHQRAAALGDIYREAGAPKEVKGIGRGGEEIVGYAYSPDLFIKSDATGVPIRHYVTLPNGMRVHPDELRRATITSEGTVRFAPPVAAQVKIGTARARGIANLGDLLTETILPGANSPRRAAAEQIPVRITLDDGSVVETTTGAVQAAGKRLGASLPVSTFVADHLNTTAPIEAATELRPDLGPTANDLIAGIEDAVRNGRVDEANWLVESAPDFGVPTARAQDILNAAADAGRKGTGVQARIEQIEQSPYFRALDYFTTRGELKRVNPTTGRPIAGIRQGGEEIWNLPGSGYDEVAAGILSSPEFGNNQNFGMTSDEFWRNARDAIREYWRLKKPRATLGGGDLAAGGGGFGLVPARLGTTLAGAGVGTGVGGLAGGGLGLAAGHEGDQLKEDVAAGAGLGALAGGSVGSASPEIGRLAGEIAANAPKLMRDTALDPGMWEDAVRAGLRAQAEAGQGPGVRGGQVVGAASAQWRAQMVNTLKQIPQDALNRAIVMWGVASKEFGASGGDLRRWQGILRGERAGQASALDNPLTARLRSLGREDLLGDLQNVYGVDFGGALELNQGKAGEFGGLGRALTGAGIGLASGLKTVNPLAPLYGAARGLAGPFVDGAIRFVNGIQHDAFRYALAEKALDTGAPHLAADFLDDLAARGVDVAPLRSKGGFFSPEEVAVLAGPQAGEAWARRTTELIRRQGDRIAFLGGDFRDKLDPKYTGKVTGTDRLLGQFERGVGKVVPFSRWTLRNAPVYAEIAARHPVATVYALRELDREKDEAQKAGKQAYQAGITISDKTPLVGLAARARNGGQAGTLTVDPLGSLIPFSDVGAGGQPLPDDATGYQRLTDLTGRAGFQPNPAIQAAAYVAGQGRAPAALSRTAGLEGLADTAPVLVRALLRGTGNPDLADRVPDLAMPGGRTVLDAARGVVAPAVEQAGLPTTGGGPSDPAERRYAEIVLARTGKPLSDPANRGLLETMGSSDNPLWNLAILQSRAAGAVGNAASLTSPVQTTAQTGAAAAAQAAPKLPYTSYDISQAPAARRPAMLAANAAAARANPASATYANIGGKSRTDQLVSQWEREHLALKRVSPTYYARALKDYKASLR